MASWRFKHAVNCVTESVFSSYIFVALPLMPLPNRPPRLAAVSKLTDARDTVTNRMMQ